MGERIAGFKRDGRITRGGSLLVVFNCMLTIAERLARLGHVQFALRHVWARGKRILIVAKGLGEIARGHPLPAPSGGDLRNRRVAATRRCGRPRIRLILLLLRHQGLELALILLDLLLLGRNELLIGRVLIPTAATASEQQHKRRRA